MAGDAVDVSTGYTLETARAWPSSNVNPVFNFGAGADLSAELAAAFDTTGFTVSGTASNATDITTILPTLTNQLQLGISNDSGTTIQVVALGNLTLPAVLGAGT